MTKKGAVRKPGCASFRLNTKTQKHRAFPQKHSPAYAFLHKQLYVSVSPCPKTNYIQPTFRTAPKKVNALALASQYILLERVSISYLI